MSILSPESAVLILAAAALIYSRISSAYWSTAALSYGASSGEAAGVGAASSFFSSFLAATLIFGFGASFFVLIKIFFLGLYNFFLGAGVAAGVGASWISIFDAVASFSYSSELIKEISFLLTFSFFPMTSLLAGLSSSSSSAPDPLYDAALS